MQGHIEVRNKNLIQRGFTLVELLVVIVILGILAAVVVFAVSGITDKGKSSACAIEVRTVNTALQAFSAKSPTNAFPPAGTAASMFAALETAGLLQESAPSATLAYAPSYDATTGTFTASCP